MSKIALLFFASVLVFAGSAQAAIPLRVVTSFSILGDITQSIGGDAVTVKTLVGPDADTHSYQPTPEDAKALAEADLVIINGLGFEGWMTRLIEASGYKGRVIIASAGIKPRTMEARNQFEPPKEIIDPHAWQNLSYGRIYAQNIDLALQQTISIPAQKINIQYRTGDYDAALVKMDDYVHREFAAIPAEQRKIITSHDAFGYFGEAYGITFLAPEGISTDADPSAADVAKLVEQIDRTNWRRFWRCVGWYALFRCALTTRRPGLNLSGYVSQ